MGQVNDVFNKDAGVTGMTGVGAVLQGHQQDGSAVGNATSIAAGNDGIGSTFMTEPLYAQFVELLTEQSFVRDIARTIPMDQPTLRVPAITSGLSVYSAGEGAEAAATTMAASDFLLQANKIMAQVVASAELYEDSVQNIEKIITDDFVRAIAQAEEQAFLIGRSTPVGSVPNGALDSSSSEVPSLAPTHIRALTHFVQTPAYQSPTTGSAFDYAEWGAVSDAQPNGQGYQNISSTPLSICDGVLTTALDEDNVIDMQGASFYGANAYKAIREAIYKLGLLGRNRGDLVLILNPVSANQLLQSEELLTLDKYGSNATILTGEVGSLFGVKIIESSFLPSAGISISSDIVSGIDTETTYSTVGKGGYGVLVHKPSLLLGDLRKVQVENERIIQNDAFRTVISERIAFGMERRSGAVALGNMDASIAPMTSTSVFFAGGVAPTLTATATTTGSLSIAGTDTATITLAASAGSTLVFMGTSGTIPTGATLAIDTNPLPASLAAVTDAAGDNSYALVATAGVDTPSTDQGTVSLYFNATEGARTSETIAIEVIIAA